MKAVHFGAGNIGRGFIGMLLVGSGYEVTFVDVNMGLVTSINDLGSYPVDVISPDGIERKIVRGVKALHTSQSDEIAAALADSDLITTSVGKAALVHVAPLLARGLRLRRKEKVPVMVVACENVLGNSVLLAKLVCQALPDLTSEISHIAAFPNCVVDRIVPNATTESDHPLLVRVEDYAQWVIDSSRLTNRPRLNGAQYTNGLEVVLAQKLCTLNMAHAIVAYWGHLAGLTYVHQAMEHEAIRELLDGALTESAWALKFDFGIDSVQQAEYTRKIIARLENPALQDMITRVARDPQRKLSPDDRLIRPALVAMEAGKMPINLAAGVSAALMYNGPGDREAAALAASLAKNGPRVTLARVSGVAEDHVLASLVQANVLFRSL